MVGINSQAMALESETALLLKLLETKGLINSGEARQLQEDIQAAGTPQNTNTLQNPKELLKPDPASGKEHFHSIQSITDRVDKLEQEFKTGTSGVLSDKLKFGVLIEVETNADRLNDGANGSSASTSDILLSTAALTMDVRANAHVSGRAVLQYEEGVEDDHVFLDEGIIFLSGKENCPYAVKAGRMYVPFGRFESHFVSDPLTLTLGETSDTALVADYGINFLNLALGGFRSDIKKIGRNDSINVYLVSLGLMIPDKALPSITLVAGVSYISNISVSNSLRDAGSGEGLAATTITEYVPGQSAFVSAVFLDKFFLDLEYLGATKHFKAGELAFDNGEALRPETWNLELAYAVLDSLELAARYEGSKDYGNIQPEQQVGLAILYKVFENTSVTLEYLKGRYANNDKRDRLAAQLSVAF